MKPWIEDFKQYRNMEKLERQVAVKLIESIEIGNQSEVVIHYHHAGEMEEMLTLAGLLEPTEVGK